MQYQIIIKGNNKFIHSTFVMAKDFESATKDALQLLKILQEGKLEKLRIEWILEVADFE